jgi:hypothetical protein
MVVDHNDTGRSLGDGYPEDLSRVHERAVQESPCNKDLAHHLALAVERQQVKLLHRQVAQTGLEQLNDVLRLPDTGEWRAFFACEAAGELEGSHEPGSLGGPDARHPEQLGGGTGREPAERAVTRFEEPLGEGPDGAAADSGSEEESQQLDGGERTGTERPQTLSRTLVGQRGDERSRHEIRYPMAPGPAYRRRAGRGVLTPAD